MIRKWFTTLLCLLLAVALPLGALADTMHTLEVIPGDDMASEQAVKDLFGALALTLTTGEQAGALTVSVQGTDVVSLLASADENGLYLSSALLGDQVYTVGWEEGFAYVENLLKTSMDGDDLAAVQQSLEQMKTAVMTLAGSTAQPEQQNAQITLEEQLAAAKAQFPDDEKMGDWIQTIVNKVTVENGEFADENRDTAAVRISLMLTAEDLLPLFETNYVRNTVMQSILTDEKDISEEELKKETDEAMAEAREVIADSGYLMTMETYTDEKNETLLGMNMSMTMQIKDDDEEEKAQEDAMSIFLNYNRLTTDKGVSHKGELNLTVTDDGKAEQMTGSLDLLNSEETADGTVALLADGQQLSLKLHKEKQEEASVKTLEVYLRGNATAIIPAAASERPLVTLKITSQAADEAFLAPVKNTQNAVSLLKLSGEEMQKLMQTVQSNGMNLLFQAMSLMPESVVQLFSGNASEN